MTGKKTSRRLIEEHEERGKTKTVDVLLDTKKKMRPCKRSKRARATIRRVR